MCSSQHAERVSQFKAAALNAHLPCKESENTWKRMASNLKAIWKSKSRAAWQPVCVRAHVCLIVYNDEMSDAVELLL